MTHVLNFALRKVCGAQLEQRGSRVLPEKFSFDFASAALGEKTVESVEAVVRDVIKCDLRVYAEIVNFEVLFDRLENLFFFER